MPLDKERFRELTKYPDDYYSGNYVFGKLGSFFARILLRTPVTPNQITWFWGGLMVLSALLYSTGRWSFCVAGGALWIIAYSLDYTDGIIARYKGISSPRGGYLDMIIHRVTYPLLMFCIGYGVYISGGCPYLDLEWFDDIWYVFFGVASGISMSVFMDVLPLYNKFKKGDTEFEDNRGSMGVEAKMVKNESRFKFIMNFNPLVFTNMMVMLLVFALLDLMSIFITIYGIGYSLATAGRILMLYKDLGSLS